MSAIAGSVGGSLESVYELAVHFDSFRNVDLFRQGLYHLRTSFYVDRAAAASTPSNVPPVFGASAGATTTSAGGASTSAAANSAAARRPTVASPYDSVFGIDDNTGSTGAGTGSGSGGNANTNSSAPDGAAVAAVAASDAALSLITAHAPEVMKRFRLALPYHLLAPSPAIARVSKAFSESNYFGAFIDNRFNKFCTRTFRVQYQEQEININDACLFRLEMGPRKRIPIFLKLELMFSEYTTTDIASGKKAALPEEFECVATRVFRLSDIYSHVHQSQAIVASAAAATAAAAAATAAAAAASTTATTAGSRPASASVTPTAASRLTVSTNALYSQSPANRTLLLQPASAGSGLDSPNIKRSPLSTPTTPTRTLANSVREAPASLAPPPLTPLTLRTTAAAAAAATAPTTSATAATAPPSAPSTPAAHVPPSPAAASSSVTAAGATASTSASGKSNASTGAGAGSGSGSSGGSSGTGPNPYPQKSSAHVFYPVTFDDQHFCLVNMMVHATLIDYKFRPKPIATPQPQSASAPGASGGAGDRNRAGTIHPSDARGGKSGVKSSMIGARGSVVGAGGVKGSTASVHRSTVVGGSNKATLQAAIAGAKDAAAIAAAARKTSKQLEAEAEKQKAAQKYAFVYTVFPRIVAAQLEIERKQQLIADAFDATTSGPLAAPHPAAATTTGSKPPAAQPPVTPTRSAAPSVAPTATSTPAKATSTAAMDSKATASPAPATSILSSPLPPIGRQTSSATISASNAATATAPASPAVGASASAIPVPIPPSQLYPHVYSRAEMIRTADAFHHYYVTALLLSFISLKQVFDQYVRECLDDAERKQFGVFAQTPPLHLHSNLCLPLSAEEQRSGARLPQLRSLALRIEPNGPPVAPAPVPAPAAPAVAATPASATASSSVGSSGSATPSITVPPSPTAAPVAVNVNAAATLDGTSSTSNTPPSASTTPSNAVSTAVVLPPPATTALTSSVATAAPPSLVTYEALSNLIESDLQSIAAQTFQLWNSFLQIIPLITKKVSALLKKEWAREFGDRYSTFVFRQCFPLDERWNFATEDTRKMHANIARGIRKQPHPLLHKPASIQDLDMLVPPDGQPVIFEESYMPDFQESKIESGLIIDEKHFAVDITPATAAPAAATDSIDISRTATATATATSGTRGTTPSGSAGTTPTIGSTVPTGAALTVPAVAGAGVSGATVPVIPTPASRSPSGSPFVSPEVSAPPSPTGTGASGKRAPAATATATAAAGANASAGANAAPGSNASAGTGSVLIKSKSADLTAVVLEDVDSDDDAADKSEKTSAALAAAVKQAEQQRVKEQAAKEAKSLLSVTPSPPNPAAPVVDSSPPKRGLWATAGSGTSPNNNSSALHVSPNSIGPVGSVTVKTSPRVRPTAIAIDSSHKSKAETSTGPPPVMMLAGTDTPVVVSTGAGAGTGGGNGGDLSAGVISPPHSAGVMEPVSAIIFGQALGGPIAKPPNSPSPLPSPLPSPALHKHEPASPLTPGPPSSASAAGPSSVAALRGHASSSRASVKYHPRSESTASTTSSGTASSGGVRSAGSSAAGTPMLGAFGAGSSSAATGALLASAPVLAPLSAPGSNSGTPPTAATAAPAPTASTVTFQLAATPTATAAPAAASGSGSSAPNGAANSAAAASAAWKAKAKGSAASAAAASYALLYKKSGELIRSLKEEAEYNESLDYRRAQRAMQQQQRAAAGLTAAAGSGAKDEKHAPAAASLLFSGEHPSASSASLSDLSALSQIRAASDAERERLEREADDEAALDRKLKSYNPLTLLPKYPGRHVIVFAHGYQGNSWDMRMLKNQIACIYPDALCLLSTSNESLTEGNIQEMGNRLAKEIDEFVKENCKADLGRLSFVCHSLGGVIARAALTTAALAPYVSKCYTYVSLATPHCGYLYSENTLLDTGLWVLKKWSKSECLCQLSLTDTPEPAQSFLHHLSQKKGLEYFAHIFLLASTADKYAPFHSARIELHRDALEDKKKGPVYHSMVANLLMPLKHHILKRFDVSFVPKKTNLDSLIGRTAHIYFLDQYDEMSGVPPIVLPALNTTSAAASTSATPKKNGSRSARSSSGSFSASFSTPTKPAAASPNKPRASGANTARTPGRTPGRSPTRAPVSGAATAAAASPVSLSATLPITVTGPTFDSTGRLTARGLIGAHNRAATRANASDGGEPLPPLLKALSERVGELVSLSGGSGGGAGGAGAAASNVRATLSADILSIVDSLHAEQKASEAVKLTRFREFRAVSDDRSALRTELDELKRRVHALDLGGVMDHGVLSLSIAEIEQQIKSLLLTGSDGDGHDTDVDDLLERVGATTTDGARNPNAPAGTAVTFHDKQNLVFLKFKRLEQLIYCLRRRLSMIELHGQRTDVIAQYGSVDSLIEKCKALQSENEKLRRRELRFVHAPLLRRRNLSASSPQVIHGLLIALQNELTAVESVVTELDTVPAAFVDKMPPPSAIALESFATAQSAATPASPATFRIAIADAASSFATPDRKSDSAKGDGLRSPLEETVASSASPAAVQSRLEIEQLRTSTLQHELHRARLEIEQWKAAALNAASEAAAAAAASGSPEASRRASLTRAKSKAGSLVVPSPPPRRGASLSPAAAAAVGDNEKKADAVVAAPTPRAAGAGAGGAAKDGFIALNPTELLLAFSAANKAVASSERTTAALHELVVSVSGALNAHRITNWKLAQLIQAIKAKNPDVNKLLTPAQLRLIAANANDAAADAAAKPAPAAAAAAASSADSSESGSNGRTALAWSMTALPVQQIMGADASCVAATDAVLMPLFSRFAVPVAGVSDGGSNGSAADPVCLTFDGAWNLCKELSVCPFVVSREQLHHLYTLCSLSLPPALATALSGDAAGHPNANGGAGGESTTFLTSTGAAESATRIRAVGLSFPQFVQLFIRVAVLTKSGERDLRTPTAQCSAAIDEWTCAQHEGADRAASRSRGGANGNGASGSGSGGASVAGLSGEIELELKRYNNHLKHLFAAYASAAAPTGKSNATLGRHMILADFVACCSDRGVAPAIADAGVLNSVFGAVSGASASTARVSFVGFQSAVLLLASVDSTAAALSKAAPSATASGPVLRGVHADKLRRLFALIDISDYADWELRARLAPVRTATRALTGTRRAASLAGQHARTESNPPAAAAAAADTKSKAVESVNGTPAKGSASSAAPPATPAPATTAAAAASTPAAAPAPEVLTGRLATTEPALLRILAAHRPLLQLLFERYSSIHAGAGGAAGGGGDDRRMSVEDFLFLLKHYCIVPEKLSEADALHTFRILSEQWTALGSSAAAGAAAGSGSGSGSGGTSAAMTALNSRGLLSLPLSGATYHDFCWCFAQLASLALHTGKPKETFSDRLTSLLTSITQLHNERLTVNHRNNQLGFENLI